MSLAITASSHYKNGHANKRRKGAFTDSIFAGLGSIMLQISNQQIQSSDRIQGSVRAREVALENREQALLKQEREFVIDMMKSEEARERRMQEHEKEQAKPDRLIEGREIKLQQRIKELEDDIKKLEEKKAAWMKDLEDRLKDSSAFRLSPC